MSDPTGAQGTAVDRLIRLLTLLPAPHREVFEPFWDQVAQDVNVGRGYVTGKIATHLLLIAVKGEPGHAGGLAKYALYFFGNPSPELVSAIAEEVDNGAPKSAPGQAWIEAVHAAALEVFYEEQTDEDVRESVVSWARHIHPKK